MARPKSTPKPQELKLPLGTVSDAEEDGGLILLGEESGELNVTAGQLEAVSSVSKS